MTDLEALVADCAPDRLPALVAQLAAAQAAAAARLMQAPAPPAEADRLVDMDEVARVLDVPVAHARELGRRGELPVVHVGRYVRVRFGALAEWMALRENGRLRSARRS